MTAKNIAINLGAGVYIATAATIGTAIVAYNYLFDRKSFNQWKKTWYGKRTNQALN